MGYWDLATGKWVAEGSLPNTTSRAPDGSIHVGPSIAGATTTIVGEIGRTAQMVGVIPAATGPPQLFHPSHFTPTVTPSPQAARSSGHLGLLVLAGMAVAVIVARRR